MIDDDVARLQSHFDMTTKHLEEELERLQTVAGGSDDIKQLASQMKANAKHLILRYCCEEEINKKRQNLLLAKSTFLAKMMSLKTLGCKNELMTRTEAWIDSNMDVLYENYKESIRIKGLAKRNARTYRQIVMSEEIRAKDSRISKAKIKAILLDLTEM